MVAADMFFMLTDFVRFPKTPAAPKMGNMKLAAILAAALLAAASGVFLVSCSKSSSGGQHATLLLRDGTNVSGTVLSSSTGEIQIAGDDKITRTIPMAQVRSIQYDDAAAAPTAPPATVPPPAATEPVAPPPAENHPTEAAVTSTRHEVPAGREVSVRTEETIDSSKAVEGQTFAADITRDVSDSDGRVVIPRGSNARIVIRSVSKGGHFRGASDLVLDLASVSVDGRLYSVSTAPIEKRGNAGVGANKRTAEFGGGGAAFGAIVGAIAGGGKGAAIGAGSGAGAGALAQILTRGSIKVPVETVLTFRLDKPLWIQAAQ